MVLGSPIGVYEPHLTVYDDALRRRLAPAEAPWSPLGDQLFPIPLTRPARALVRAKGKVNALPVLAVVFLLLDLRGESASACSSTTHSAPSKPVIPLHAIIAQSGLMQQTS